MGITKLAVKLAVPLPDITAYDRYLFIGPHPDDIEIGAGALIARLTDMGKKVSFLICTDGRFGDALSNGVKGDELADLRRKESLASADALGVSDVHFLNLCDGGNYRIADLETGIAETVGTLQPQIIFAPDPLSKSECHADHLNVGRAAAKIACFAPYPGIMEKFGASAAPVDAVAFYMTAHANRIVATKSNLSRQLKALFDCHASQYPASSQERASLELYLKLRSVDYGLRIFSPGGAEGYRVLGKTHMHCLPEAGE